MEVPSGLIIGWNLREKRNDLSWDWRTKTQVFEYYSLIIIIEVS